MNGNGEAKTQSLGKLSIEDRDDAGNQEGEHFPLKFQLSCS